MYIVYAKTDEQGRVTDINSSAFLDQTEGWVEIARGDTPTHMHAQGRYLPAPIYDEDGRYNWGLSAGMLYRRSDEEKALDIIDESHGTGNAAIDGLTERVDSHDQQIAMLLEGVTAEDE